MYGEGAQTRSFCYVSDLIAGMMALLTVAENPGEPVNIGNPNEFTILELAGLVLELIGSRQPIVFEPLHLQSYR